MTIDPEDFAEFQEFQKWKRWKQAQEGGAVTPAPAPPPKKHAPVFEELWVGYRKHGKQYIPSWDNCQATAEKHLLRFFGPKRWDEITVELVIEYREIRAAQPKEIGGGRLTAATRNQEVKYLRQCLSWALERKKIPFHPVPKVKKETEVDNRDWVPTPEDMARLFRHLRPSLRLMASISAEVGMRFTEVRLLRWSEVHLDGDDPYIALPKSRTKAKKARVVPIGPVTISALRSAPRHIDSPGKLVFPSDLPKRKGGPIPASTLRQWWKEAREEAGIQGPNGEPMPYHMTRHFAAVRAALNGMPWPLMKQVFGWKNDSTASRYQHFMRDSVAKVSEVWAKRSESEGLIIPITSRLAAERLDARAVRSVESFQLEAATDAD